MTSIFTKIIQGKISSYKVAENKNNIAFLNINPIKRGHVLVVPKKETDKIFDLSIFDFLNLMKFSYQVAKAIEKVIPCKRIAIAVLGLEISHAHIHLIPIDQESDFNFFRPKIFFSEKEFNKLSLSIQKSFKDLII